MAGQGRAHSKVGGQELGTLTHKECRLRDPCLPSSAHSNLFKACAHIMRQTEELRDIGVA
jgi:hypothetical protein